jgi:hypothetical protein
LKITPAANDYRIAAAAREAKTRTKSIKYLRPLSRLREYGGDGGIRTLDRALQPYNGLANRRLQPLGHVSKPSASGRNSTDAPRAAFGAGGPASSRRNISGGSDDVGDMPCAGKASRQATAQRARWLNKIA